jgi:hypothetical protein
LMDALGIRPPTYGYETSGERAAARASRSPRSRPL